MTANRLTEHVAAAYAADGVVAYSVHPGPVVTTVPEGMPEAWLAGMLDEVGLCGTLLVWLTRERRAWLSGRYISATWDVGELEAMEGEIVEEDKLKMRMVV